MKKNFWPWHKLKSTINELNSDNVYFREKEVWFCSLGLNVGQEQDGKNSLFERPVIIFKKFNQRLFWGIPTTSTVKKGEYYFTLKWGNKKYSAILSQIRLLDANRLSRRIRHLPTREFDQLRMAFKKLL